MEVISVPDSGFSLEPKPAADPAIRDENQSKGLVRKAERANQSMGASAARMAQQTFTRKPKISSVDTTKISTEDRGKWQSLVLTFTRYGASRRLRPAALLWLHAHDIRATPAHHEEARGHA